MKKMNDLVKFEDSNGIECRLVRYNEENKSIVFWRKGRVIRADESWDLMGKSINKCTKAELDAIDLYDKADPEVRKRLEEQEVIIDTEVKNRMAHARRGRRSKRKNSWPENLTCECGFTTKANYTLLKRKAEKDDTTVEKLIEEYKCSVCKGGKRKGRVKK